MLPRIINPMLLAGLLLCTATVTFAQTPAAAAPPPTTTTPAAAVGQTITLDNTAYVVNAKKQLAAGVEYYTVKTTASKAVNRNYLRTNNTYGATVFTQAQYESFLKTGKLSAFGTVKVADLSGEKVDYVNVGSTSALLFVDGKGLIMVEMPTVAATDNNGSGGGATDAQKACIAGCQAKGIGCMAAAEKASDPDVKAGAKKGCKEGYGRCIGNCYFAAPVNVSSHFVSSGKVVTK